MSAASTLRPPARTPLFSQTPPAAFLPVLGLLGLVHAWRAGHGAFGFGPGVIDLASGAVSLLYIFLLVAYVVKLARRPGVIGEDLATLPGRAGLAAASMGAMLLAAALVSFWPGIALAMVWGALAFHAALAFAVAYRWITGPVEARQVTPVLHLVFVGIIVAPAALGPLGQSNAANAVLWASVVLSAVIYALSLGALVRDELPPPLRPPVVIHLAPASLVATAAFATDGTLLASAALAFATLLAVFLVFRARWIAVSGFSPFWSAFTFPVSAFAGAWFAADAAGGGEPARLIGGAVLIAATLTTPIIAFRVLRLWARGTLAATTNAARA